MKTRIFYKLFGGPFHGKRFAVPDDQIAITFPKLKQPTISQYDVSLLKYDEIVYTKRRAKFGKNIVYFFAIKRATDAEAFEILCNYLLRNSKVLCES